MLKIIPDILPGRFMVKMEGEPGYLRGNLTEAEAQAWVDGYRHGVAAEA